MILSSTYTSDIRVDYIYTNSIYNNFAIDTFIKTVSFI